VRALEIFRQKLFLEHTGNLRIAIYEIVIWRVPESKEFPEGIKYRVWLSEGGRTIFGIDNHRPKGHHIHLNSVEIPYLYRGIDELKHDAAKLIKQEGFIYED
jgi:hypothetical protein